jgi:hypothetical protein
MSWASGPNYRVDLECSTICGGARLLLASGGTAMAKGGRETKKPKQDKPKTNAAAPSQKGTVASIPQSKK